MVSTPSKSDVIKIVGLCLFQSCADVRANGRTPQEPQSDISYIMENVPINDDSYFVTLLKKIIKKQETRFSISYVLVYLTNYNFIFCIWYVMYTHQDGTDC